MHATTNTVDHVPIANTVGAAIQQVSGPKPQKVKSETCNC
jgi:hypothetical protein